MDSSLADDRMDLASSPFPQADDLDLEFDTMREPSVDPMNADMIDEDLEHIDFDNDAFQGNDEDMSPDDDMLDEDAFDQEIQAIHGEDHNDTVHIQDKEGVERDEDEDVLYEEEEDLSVPTIKARNDEINIEIGEEHRGEEPQETLENLEPIAKGIEVFDSTPTNAPDLSTTDNQEEIVEDGTHEHTGLDFFGEDPLGHKLDTKIKHFEGSAKTTEETGINEGGNEDNAKNIPSFDEAQELQDQPVVDSQDQEYDQNDAVAKEEVTDLGILPSKPPEKVASTEKHNKENAVPSISHSQLNLVRVVYLGEEMSLFPPPQEEGTGTFFLSDPNLAFENLEKLLAACREILSGSIGHDDELILDIQALGLHICEDSKYSSHLTLSQILETYLILSRNEATEELQPLMCILSSRVCLASQYAYLSAAAKEGKSFTEISADYLDSPFENSSHNDEPLDEALVTAQTATEIFTDNSAHVGDQESVDDNGEEVREQNTFNDLTNPVRDNHEDGREEVFDPDKEHAHATSEQSQPHFEQEMRLEFPTFSASSAVDDNQKAELYNKPANASNEKEAPELDEETPKPPYSLSLEDETNLEAETDSSHTLQADHENNPLQDYVDLPLDEEADSTASAVGEDQAPFGHNEQDFLEEYEEDVANGEDELYQPEIHGDQGVLQDDHMQRLNQTTRGSNFKTESDLRPLEEAADQTNYNMQASNNDTPVTPMKGKPAKRKALEEEDEFDLLDSNTPEPKRRRPS